MKKSVPKEEISLKSSDIYKKIFDLTPDAIIVLNTKGKIINTNGSFTDWIGYKPEEVIGKTIATLPLMSNKTKLLVAKKYAERLLGKDLEPYIIEMTAKDKSIKKVEIRGAPIKNDDGKVIGDLVVAKNVTEIEKSHSEAEEATSRINAILASMEDMVLVFDEKNRLVFHNSTTSASSSFNPSEYVGKSVADAFPDAIAKAHLSCFEKNRAGQVCEFEYTVTESDGSKNWFSSKMSPIMIEGEFKGCVSVIRDVTSKKSSETILKTKNDELQKLNDLMIDREEKMAQLKEEIGRLRGQT